MWGGDVFQFGGGEGMTYFNFGGRGVKPDSTCDPNTILFLE